MTRRTRLFVRAAAGAAVLALSPGFPTYDAAAQVLSASAEAVGAEGAAGIAGAAGAAVVGGTPHFSVALPDLSLRWTPGPTPCATISSAQPGAAVSRTRAGSIASVGEFRGSPAFAASPLGAMNAAVARQYGPPAAVAPSIAAPGSTAPSRRPGPGRGAGVASPPASADVPNGGADGSATSAPRAGPSGRGGSALAQAESVAKAWSRSATEPDPRDEADTTGLGSAYLAAASVNDAAAVRNSAPAYRSGSSGLSRARSGRTATSWFGAQSPLSRESSASAVGLGTPGKPRTGGGVRWSALLAVGALAFLTPTIALAAAPILPAAAAAIPSAAAVSILSTVHPLASVVGAAAGAVYGLFAARKADPSPSAGAVLASVLRYGILSGAGFYVLGDLARLVFLGSAAGGIATLPAAAATAALGQSAFQGKFADPSTSSADRIMGAFPAVAAALGLSVNVGLGILSWSGIYAAATAAMAVTAVAAAVYAAVFKPGTSPAEGPAAMARGFVLQTLMLGLALALRSQLLLWPFLALAAWGFWDVLSAVGAAAAALAPAAARKLFERKS